MITKTHTALAVVVAGSTSAQLDTRITVDNVQGDQWRISAEFLTSGPGPLITAWSDASFELAGDGSPITIASYNPQYDTTLGNAQVSNGPVASFVGNANSFFGVTDTSNPLPVVEFEYVGSFGALELTLVGQNSLNFDAPPFGQVYLYQDSLGNPGPWTWEVIYIPRPRRL